MNQLFFELIKVALHRQDCLSHVPSAKEWMELYHIAEKQALLGVCFYAIRRLDEKGQSVNIPGAIRMQWLGVTAQIQRKNEVLNRRCVELQNMLKDAGFRSCILKGQSMAKLYNLNFDLNHNKDDNRDNFNNSKLGLGLYRQSGDIDVWLEGSRRQIMEYVNSVAPTDDVRWLHTRLDVFDDAEVEIHFMPSYLECPWHNRALQRFFESEKEACFATDSKTGRFNQVFILAHAFRHLFSEGVGMRQLMDYYFVLLNLNLDLNVNHNTNATFRSFGMERFAEAVMWIMQQVFGLESEYLLCEPSEKYGRVLLNEVMKSGNFGHQDERVNRSKNESAIHRFWRIGVYNCRVMSFSPWTVISSPLWRLWHWCWRKKNGYR